MNIPVVSEVVKYGRLAFDLRDFLKERISLEQSKQVLSDRLQNRGRNFLSLVKKSIYDNPRSPYLKLLRVAGCEFGDIEAAVNKDGVESTLQKLLAEGVYLSWEEFKGKRDIIRGTNRFRFREADFDNPFLIGYYEVRSSGSRSAGTKTKFDLRYRAETTQYNLLMLAVHNALGVPMGLWLPELPSAAGVVSMLRHWCIGEPVVKWFSPVTEGQTRASLRDRAATRYIVYGGRMWGAKLVAPEHVGLTEALRVAQWMAETKREFGDCSLSCFVSLGAMVCQAALAYGLNIEKTRLFVGGEPLSEAKLQQMEAAGVLVVPMYHISEIGFIGCGCPEADVADDVHLFLDSVASISHERKVEHADINVNAFLFTSLLPSAPKILLNVESDDCGIMRTESCGCLFGGLGFTEHLCNIRSFAKLTGSGMTIIGSGSTAMVEAGGSQFLEDGEGKTKFMITLEVC